MTTIPSSPFNATSHSDANFESPDMIVPEPLCAKLDTTESNRRILFPVKLHRLLTRSEYDPVIRATIGWDIHGRSFRIIRSKELEFSILPKYFKITKVKSFIRQLSLYNFTRITAGKDQGAYYHINFLRGIPDRCDMIRREQTRAMPEPNLRGISGHDPKLYDLPMLPHSVSASQLNLGDFENTKMMTNEHVITKTVESNQNLFASPRHMPCPSQDSIQSFPGGCGMFNYTFNTAMPAAQDMNMMSNIVHPYAMSRYMYDRKCCHPMWNGRNSFFGDSCPCQHLMYNRYDQPHPMWCQRNFFGEQNQGGNFNQQACAHREFYKEISGPDEMGNGKNHPIDRMKEDESLITNGETKISYDLDPIEFNVGDNNDAIDLKTKDGIDRYEDFMLQLNEGWKEDMRTTEVEDI